MRNIIDKLSFLLEDRTLNAGTITKYPERFQKFLTMIKTGAKFYTVDKTPVVADPKEAKRFMDLQKNGQFKGPQEIKLNDGTVIGLNQLLKTADLGGQASTGEEGETTGKETAQLKPTQIGITDKEIPASELGKTIINNPVLNSTDYGKVVIQMAQTIMAGNNPTIPKEVPDRVRSSIIDYAGEYLGVLALVQGQTRFPRRRGFEEWLGGDVGSLTISFPSKSNLNIADSFASIKNQNTNHKINISSKGSGGGAPPSLSGLKIPKEVRSNPEYANVVEFIDLCDVSRPSAGGFPGPKSISQTFEAMNLLHKYAPDSLPSKFNDFLPWPPDITQLVTLSMAMFKQKGKGALPEFKKLWSDIKFKKDSSDGGKLVHATKLAVLRAINEGNALPEFQKVVLIVLDKNFLQNYTDYDAKSKVVSFSTQWPAQLDGKITLESKSGATDPTKGGLSFKLSSTEPKTKLDQPDELDAGSNTKVNTTKDLSKAADVITKAHKPISMAPKKEVGNVGRKKRN